ncbi:MAG: hypothetical protein OXU88_07115 [Gammaproteobacteria bacterium]|nr:hypothetical protein [Gammaproteobacteria bacterium]
MKETKPIAALRLPVAVVNAGAVAAGFFELLKRYIGGGFRGLAGRGVGGRRGALDSPAALGEFLDSRASHVAQTALYGYMKTRAGTRFPALFEDPAMLTSINIAKWHVWAACLSDLAVYSGVLLRRDSGAPAETVRAALMPLVARALESSGGGGGERDEAGEDFPAAVARVKARLAGCDLDALGDDDSAFTESPRALVHWAPIADELKRRDAGIVRNSVRFRWQEIRRDLRRRLRAREVMAAAGVDGAGAEAGDSAGVDGADADAGDSVGVDGAVADAAIESAAGAAQSATGRCAESPKSPPNRAESPPTPRRIPTEISPNLANPQNNPPNSA